MKDLGLLQVYTGDGKGKTTAAVGQAVRAAGRGQRVIIIQFLKENLIGTGEDKGLGRAMLPIIVKKYGEDLLGKASEARKRKAAKRASEGLAYAKFQMEKEKADMIVLDEVSHLMNLGLVNKSEIVDFMNNRPTSVELILTGRDMPEEIMNRADLITEMGNVKHPYDKGTAARAGIEY